MGEGFIVRRGGGGQQTVKPIYNSLTEAGFTSLTLSVTNDSNSVATLYYSVVQTEPGPTTPDTFDTEFDGKETKDITITGLTQGTTYTVYIKAVAVGEFPSETVIVTDLTTGVALSATGGSISTIDNYRYHVFTGNGTFQVTQLSNIAGFNDVDYLIVAGGGGGSNDHGGGGGAGGLLTGTFSTPTITNYNVTVGAGGTGGPALRSTSSGLGTNGQNSTLFSFTAIGGGRAGSLTNGAAASGGSGGGGGGGFSGAGTTAAGAGTSGQGFAGGTGFNSSPPYTGGGGGGATQAGAIGTNSNPTGNGGAGLNLSTVFPNWGTNSSNTTTGTRGFFAGGGGGCSRYNANVFGLGGVGGGARGATNTSPAVSGTANTGGGGGGANRYAAGGTHASSSIGPAGAGGSGIVIIRYEIAPSV
jgi:hypothetical protein